MLDESKLRFGIFLIFLSHTHNYVLHSMYSTIFFFLPFPYYYQVHESEFRYPIFHVLDKQILRTNKPQSVYLSCDTFSYSAVSVMFLFYYLRT